MPPSSTRCMRRPALTQPVHEACLLHPPGANHPVDEPPRLCPTSSKITDNTNLHAPATHQEGKALAVLAAGVVRHPDLSDAAHRLKHGSQIALACILRQALQQA